MEVFVLQLVSSPLFMLVSAFEMKDCDPQSKELI